MLSGWDSRAPPRLRHHLSGSKNDGQAGEPGCSSSLPTPRTPCSPAPRVSGVSPPRAGTRAHAHTQSLAVRSCHVTHSDGLSQRCAGQKTGIPVTEKMETPRGSVALDHKVAQLTNGRRAADLSLLFPGLTPSPCSVKGGDGMGVWWAAVSKHHVTGDGVCVPVPPAHTPCV